MKKQVLVIQGAGEGAYIEDKALAGYLESALDSGYEVRYPEFSGLENVAYDTWRTEISAELDNRGDQGIIVAHSLGGPALLKYLSEERCNPSIAGLFLIAAPYKCKDGEWGTDDFALDVTFASTLPDMGAIFMYHSRDDEWVPFAHLAQWAEKIPNAIARQFDDRGHSFSKVAFAELVADIKSLPRNDPKSTRLASAQGNVPSM